MDAWAAASADSRLYRLHGDGDSGVAEMGTLRKGSGFCSRRQDRIFLAGEELYFRVEAGTGTAQAWKSHVEAFNGTGNVNGSWSFEETPLYVVEERSIRKPRFLPLDTKICSDDPFLSFFDLPALVLGHISSMSRHENENTHQHTFISVLV
jgi:hypothetical protein